MSGPAVAAVIREAAAAEGVSLTEFLRPVSRAGANVVGNLETSRFPTQATLDTIRRAFALRGLPEPALPDVPTSQGWSGRTGYAFRDAIARKQVDQERQILTLLTAAADAGVPCPTNRSLAGAVGISPSAIETRLRHLARMGTITIEPSGNGTRIAKIDATGRQTAGERGEAMQRAPARLIDREPCFKCGIRGDLGCRHRPLELRS